MYIYRRIRAQFKTIAKISIREYIKKHVLKYLEKAQYRSRIPMRYYGYSVAIDFTDSPKGYVTLNQDKYHPSYTVIDGETGEIANNVFYDWLYEDDPEPYLQYHTDLLDFYDWYCKACTDKLPCIRKFTRYRHLYNLLEFYELNDVFETIFKRKSLDIKQAKKPSELKELILNFDQYKEMFEISML